MSANELKIVIMGRTGQVARQLQALLPAVGSVISIGRPEIDLAVPETLQKAIGELRPDVLINAAAYTAVDKAESERELAMKINGEAPGIMAEEIKKLGAIFINYSSDYVFDGEKSGPYLESDEPNPLNVYGTSKLAGDRAVQAADGAYLIFRTSWVYGAEGRNFLKTIVKLAAERDEIKVVADQIGAPTWSREIAKATRQIIAEVSASGRGRAVDRVNGRSGIYNMVADGAVSWYGFASSIVEELQEKQRMQGALARIKPVPTSEYPTAARRPHNSRLASEKLWRVFATKLPPWRESLNRVIADLIKPIHAVCDG